MKRIRVLISFALVITCLAGAFCRCLAEDDIPLVILDTDMGVFNDDAMALSLLLKAEEAGMLRVIGITLEGGNNFIDADYINYGEVQPAETKNITDLLALIGREDIPVYRGTDYPAGTGPSDTGMLSAFYESLPYLQANSGYGAVHFYENLSSGALADSNDARDFLLSCAKEYPGRVTVIAIGPVMNLARAAEADSSFASNIAAVYYMAGAFGAPCEAFFTSGEPVQAVGGANITPWAEYNVCYDALSLSTCVTAGFPVQVFLPGEVNAPIGTEEVKRIEEANAGKGGIAALWLDRYASVLPGYPYWDPLTVTAFLKAENLRGKTSYVTIVTDRADPFYAMTTALTEEEYALLEDAQKERYGKAFVAEGYDDFWDVAIELLCK